MAYRFFPWRPMPSMKAKSAPGVLTVSFGKGYEERRKEGINNNLKSYSVSFRVLPDEAERVNAFLDSAGGVEAFEVYSYTKKRNVIVVCSDWTEDKHKHYSQFDMVFREVVR